MKSPGVFIFIFFMIAIASCSKNGSQSGSANNAKDTSAPVITISSPINNQVFSSGQTIQVSASAVDNVKLTELHIDVLNASTGSILRDVHSYPNDKTGTVEDSFVAQAGLSYTIKIIALDPSQNLSTTQVDVSAN